MKNILSLLFIANILFVNAQQLSNEQCGSEVVHQFFLQNGGNLQRHLQIEQLIYNASKSGIEQPAGRSDFELPVVVHIIHNGGSENISDVQAIKAIDYLNQAFRNTALYDSTVGVDTRIQFCLAKKNPQGQATTGINRVQSALTDLDISQDLSMKNLSRWDPTCYVNIWVVKTICSQGSCNIGGYAYLPSAHGKPFDGIVVRASTMGSTPAATGTLIHEAGHYLGLYHTFQGGCTNSNCLSDGDKVCDTPPDNSTAYIACASTMNSCSTDALSGFTTDQPDQHKNYMDYTTPACRTIFSAGQRDRMIWHTQNIRASLQNCSSCFTPCTTAINALFAASVSTVAVGGTVNFTNQSSGATSYKWLVNGAQFATTANSAYTFNNDGAYIIRLEARGADTNCVDYFTDTITANCGLSAGFSANNTNPATGQAVTFTNFSTGATSYQWFVDGVLQGTSTNLSYTFNQVGSYSVYLVATSSFCSDTTPITYFIHVGAPCNVSFGWTPQNANTCLAVKYEPDTSCKYTNYLWTFCEPDYLDSLKTQNYAHTGGGTAPAGVKFIKDENGNYYVFYCLYTSGNNTALRRMKFGSSIKNTPVVDTVVVSSGLGAATNLHGFDAVYHNGSYYGFLIFNNGIYRVNFGGTLDNKTVTATQVTGISSGINWGHKIEIVRETNNWWLIVAARTSSAITLLYLGNNVTNNVQSQSSHAVNGCSGFSYHKISGNHYIYGVGLFSGVRIISFGNSLTNTPTLSNYYLFNSGVYPDDIALYQNCDGSLSGVLLYENVQVHQLVKFNTPTAAPIVLDTFTKSTFRISGMSRLLRTDQGLTTFATQGANNSLVKLNFADCGIPYSTLKFPPPVAYNKAGSYYVRLAVDEGLPTQQVYCRNVNVTNVSGNPVNLGQDTTLCYSGVRTLKAGPSYKTYLWHDGITDSSTSVFGEGKYFVRVEDYCGNVFSDTIVISVDSATQIILGNDTSICVGQSVQLNAGNKYVSYSWTPSGGLNCSNCANPLAAPTTTSSYSVTGKNQSGCVSAASVTVNVSTCLGVEDVEDNLVKAIYPVPTSERLNISLNAAEEVKILLFNAVGQQLKNSSDIQYESQNLVSLDVSELAAGIYLLEVSTSAKKSLVKIVIQ